MPHQCLKCGKTFGKGSSQLLKGCPDCGGNRFFFTKEPLSEKERNNITNRLDDDIKSTIVRLISEKDSDIFDAEGKLVTIKPKDVRKVVEKIATKNHLMQIKKKTGKQEKIVDKKEGKHKLKKLTGEKTHVSEKEADHPETIHVKAPGDYEIDLQGLLHDEPIIIQKNGIYTIHLPSIFETLKKDERDK